MRFKKVVKRVASATIIGAMLLSVTGCQAKAMTTEKLLEKMEKKSLINKAVAEKVLSDDVVTGKELQSIVNNINSFSGNVTVDFAGSIESFEDGLSQSADIDIALKTNYAYDKKTKSAKADVGMNLNLMVDNEPVGGEISKNMLFQIQNENGTYYSYVKDGENVAVRQELGKESELWDSIELSVDDILSELGLNTKEELLNMLSPSLEENKDTLSLAKDKVKYKDRDCYELTYTVNGSKILEDLKTTPMPKTDGNIEDILQKELKDGYTINDLAKDINFSVKCYVDAKDFYITYTEVDLQPVLEKISDAIIDAAMSSAAMSSDVTAPDRAGAKIDVRKATISFSYVEGENTNVKFNGEYIE